MKKSYWIISAVIALAGMGLMGIGHHQYVKAQENVSPLTESYSGIDKIDLNIGSAEVNLSTDKNAKDVTVTILHPRDSVQVRDENGTLKIFEKSKVFTFIPVWGSLPMQINVTVPENVTLENLNFDLGSGKGNISGINVKACSADLGSGSLKFDNMNAVNELTLECGSGKMEVSDSQLNSLKLEAGSGSIFLNTTKVEKNLDLEISSGTIRSDGLETAGNAKLRLSSGSMTFNNVTFGTETDISISSGSAVFNLTGKESDYSFNCKTSSGKTSIGENSGKDLVQSGGEKKIVSDCSSGSVRFQFSE
jgi:hypothetical protein